MWILISSVRHFLTCLSCYFGESVSTELYGVGYSPFYYLLLVTWITEKGIQYINGTPIWRSTVFIVVGVGDRGTVVCRRLCMSSSYLLLPSLRLDSAGGDSGTKPRAVVFIVEGIGDCERVVCGWPVHAIFTTKWCAGGNSGTKSRAGEASGGGDPRPGTMSAMWNSDIVV